jgi:hypothetical protein
MIKPMDEYSPEDRAFVEFVQRMRSQPPQPQNDPGPLNWEEINSILADVNPEDELEDLGLPFAVRYKDDAR